MAIVAVCVVEWKAAIADAVVETHDRIVGKTWREAKKLCDAQFDDAKAALPRVLRSFTGLGEALLEAQNDGAALEHVVSSGPGWAGLVREQYADTGGGFTDHVFAITALIGYQFIPRIRDLPSKRLHVFDPGAVPNELRALIGSKIRNTLIASNWPDVLRKFASYPRQHDLAAALREIGRVERTLFIIDWVLDPDMRRRAQIGLNKGESHHALKNALRIGRQGEIRDRSSEGQHYRMAGLNLLAAIVIYWNTSSVLR